MEAYLFIYWLLLIRFFIAIQSFMHFTYLFNTEFKLSNVVIYLEAGWVQSLDWGIFEFPMDKMNEKNTFGTKTAEKVGNHYCPQQTCR